MICQVGDRLQFDDEYKFEYSIMEKYYMFNWFHAFRSTYLFDFYEFGKRKKITQMECEWDGLW